MLFLWRIWSERLVIWWVALVWGDCPVEVGVLSLPKVSLTSTMGLRGTLRPDVIMR